jgi:co-chaperonin GroES (HSP10)
MRRKRLGIQILENVEIFRHKARNKTRTPEKKMRGLKHIIIDYPEMVRKERTYGTLTIIEDQHTKKEWKYILHGEVIAESDHLPEIKIGDIVYFKYLVPEGDNRFDGKMKIPVEDIFCFVREGIISTCNGYVLTEPYYPADTEDVEVEGHNIKAKIEKGLVTKIGVKYDKKITKVCCAPDGADFGSGDIVVMTSFSDQEYEIEGKNYFVIEVDEIIAKLN